MSRGFHLWHSQPLDRVTPPWLANPRPPAMSPHANGTRYLSHWFVSGRIKGEGRNGGKRMIQRPNEENGRQESVVLSTWRWFKQGWPRLSQMTDRWPRPRSLLLTVLKKFLTSLKTLPSTVPLVFISSATSSLSVLPSSMFFANQRPHENLPRNTMHTVTSYRAADNNRLSGNVQLQFVHARPRISFLERKTIWLSVSLVWTPSGLRVKLRPKERNNSQHCWPNSVGSWYVHLHGPKRLNGFKLCATTPNNMQQGVQTDATCNIQQRWELLAKKGAPVYTGICCPFILASLNN